MEVTLTAPQPCPSCKNIISNTDNFCPNCGKKLRSVPLATTIGKQLSVYFISVFLPPLGFIPAFQYLLEKESKAKAIGAAAMILTVISSFITLYYTMGFIKQFQALIGGVGY